MSRFLEVCRQLETSPAMPTRDLLGEFDLISGHPWEETFQSSVTNYYSCLYGIATEEHPTKVLEIGTAFGLSAATLLRACSPVELFVSMDLGIYGDQLGFGQDNIEYARTKIHGWCHRKGIPSERVRFYRANSQPEGEGDNEDAGAEIVRWYEISEIVRLLTLNGFDIVFVDGKHTGDGLLNDLETFWRFLKPGGLVICDDLHDEATYKGVFPWAGDTDRSYREFLNSHSQDISDSFVWDFPRVPPGGVLGQRPFGLIRKKERGIRGRGPGTAKFGMFDSHDAIEVNRARLDHLASLGLDLVGKSVLEVGSGVGWLTGFFEKLGCSVLSTDARPENVAEHLNRFPERQGKVVIADLSCPGSHARFGVFDIVHCYGTLYHLGDPALCIKDLSSNCRHLFLLETCVSLEDDGSINAVVEDHDNPNQAFLGVGCRPGRDWVMSELKRYFPYVYVSHCQPDHPEFPLSWPAELEGGVQNRRAVFVASRAALELPTLSPRLLKEQRRLPSVLDGLLVRDKVTAETVARAAEEVSPRPTATRCGDTQEGERDDVSAGDERGQKTGVTKDTRFPAHDAYWVAAADFLERHIGRGERILAPDEFVGKFPGKTIPYSGGSTHQATFEWAVVHKGTIGSIGRALLRRIRRGSRPVFANEVFVVFSGHKELPRIGLTSPHVRAFWARIWKEERPCLCSVLFIWPQAVCKGLRDMVRRRR